MAELKNIPLKSIRESPVALRAVNRQSEEYLGLVDSIRRVGVLNAVNVRAVKDSKSGETVYGLVDGLHRFSAAQDAGLKEIPAQIVDLAEGDILEAQIMANVHKVETKPVEYSKQLMRILTSNPLLTLSELATKLAKSPAWLNERLGLVKLHQDIAPLVDQGRVNLSNAYALAKLPPEEQANFLDRAMTMSPQEFVPTATARIKEIRDAKRQGRDAAPVGFVPVPHVRKVSELKEEMVHGHVAKQLIKDLNLTNPADAFQMGVKWALHMDPQSIEVARQKDEQRKKDAEAEKAKKKKEKEEAKNKAAAEATAALSTPS